MKHRKSVDDRKEAVILIRLTAATKAELVRSAKAAGLSLSEWVLQATAVKLAGQRDLDLLCGTSQETVHIDE